MSETNPTRLCPHHKGQVFTQMWLPGPNAWYCHGCRLMFGENPYDIVARVIITRMPLLFSSGESCEHGQHKDYCPICKPVPGSLYGKRV